MAVKPLIPNPVHVSASALIANLTSTPWDGIPPSESDRSRPHWLMHREGEGEPDIADWHGGKWWFPGIQESYTPHAVGAAYRYLGPAGRPEAEALADAYCDFAIIRDRVTAGLSSDGKPLLEWQAACERLQQAELAYRAALRRE